MITTLLIVLFVLDLVLLAGFFLVSKKQEIQGDLLADLTEERRLLTELRNSVKEELTAAQRKNKEVVARVSHIAAEAELEVKTGGQSLASGMEEIVAEISSRFEAPLRELSRKQAASTTLMRRMDQESKRMLKIVNRGEQIAKFFDEKTPYSDVLKEIETKRYDDCRSLLSQGMSCELVANELGITKSEVEIISSLT